MVLICSKVDEPVDVLSNNICNSILNYCQSTICDTLSHTEGRNKVVLLNEIIHFTAKTNVQDPSDPRKNPKYLRELIAALWNFHSQGSFHIPNNWDKIGGF